VYLILVKNNIEFNNRTNAINKMIYWELIIFNRYVPGKINNVEKNKKNFVSSNIFLKFPPLLNW